MTGDFASLPGIHQAHEQARDELRRADTKATTLLSLVGAALAGVIALSAQQTSVAAIVALWLAFPPVFAAVLVLLAAIRPRLSQFPTPGTWLHAAHNGPATLLEASSHAATHNLATHTAEIASIAVAKYRRIQRAIELLFTGLCLLSVALLLAVLT
ncbi:hypothetical protein BAY61_02430 [Prauserella marina]|uniref:Pycsar effector protein domain-containing protein n=1 Tax=Prauserella marina TaxID=530584 RepID=A0A222VYY3_9PSEU|nr:Pycsar system effector family protein [Prauserella marina]ASR38893.1 hypothetical protein BAY61_02430 [Prauserella marina]PWV82662.1 hypothetical protein DES30_102906 [Prauserella marina]SDC74108.1 hypothetical protein SAMN05421630_103442 [Prauserella marina]